MRRLASAIFGIVKRQAIWRLDARRACADQQVLNPVLDHGPQANPVGIRWPRFVGKVTLGVSLER